MIVIYDDTIKPNEKTSTIIGNNSFGEIILKRKKLYKYVSEVVSKNNIKFYKLDSLDNDDFLKNIAEDEVVFHIQSSAAINDAEEFELILEKAKYVKENTVVMKDKIFAIIFPNKSAYEQFLDSYDGKLTSKKSDNIISTHCFTDISDYNNLLIYISSGFDARYFNSLQGDNYSITKKSKDKKKMKMEYEYYWLLPSDMKNWMVMPYDYKETEDYASYTMERMPMTDIAIRWTHGAIDLEEMDKILDKTFHFFSIRHEKEISKEGFKKLSDNLYEKKVIDRISDLKKCKEYPIFADYIKQGTEYETIDDIIDAYMKLYTKSMNNYYKKHKKFKTVIGHGDVFFANMLYSKEINLLRLIDPKGALEVNDLWTNPYYDIAKLSHSICGNYDFFNTNLYDISLDGNMKFKLSVFDNGSEYKELFKKYLEKNGYDYILIRVYEASLFLSMLPLHIDNPHKVFGYLLNAINIIKELEQYV